MAAPTLEDLLAERERRQRAAAPPPSLEDLQAEKERRRLEALPFPEDPELTPERIADMGELTDISAMLEGRDRGTLTNIQERASQALLNATTGDPMELAQIMQERFGDTVDVRLSPEGVPVVRNKETGQEAVINRPGLSPMDVFQTIGLIGAYAPTARLAGMGRNVMQRLGLGVAGSAGTEAALQAAQEEAGGEFDEEDIAMSAALGAVPEAVAEPAVRALQKVITAPKIPQGIRDAIEYARSTGRRLMTSDVLGKEAGPVPSIMVRLSQRIPLVGTGKARREQLRQRGDTLQEIVDEYQIDIDTEIGQSITEDIMDTISRRRFWGKNKNPSEEQLRRGLQREADEIVDKRLADAIRGGNIDEGVVDASLAGSTDRIKELISKLNAEGKKALQQRFLIRALNKAGWTPESPQLANPNKFAAFLDKPQTRRAFKQIFDETQQRQLSGVKEFLRLSKEAEEITKGVGFLSSSGSALIGMMSLGTVPTLIGTAARTYQSRPVRNLLLRLHYAKGDPKKTKAIMDDLRPLLLGAAQRIEEGDLAINADAPITGDMIKQEDTSLMEDLRSAMGTAGEVGQEARTRLQEMLRGYSG